MKHDGGINTLGVQMNRDLFEEILNGIEAQTVPSKYVIMCMATLYDGSEELYTGKEFEEARNQKIRIREYKFYLDVKKIHQDITDEVAEIYDEVNRRFGYI